MGKKCLKQNAIPEADKYIKRSPSGGSSSHIVARTCNVSQNYKINYLRGSLMGNPLSGAQIKQWILNSTLVSLSTLTSLTFETNMHKPPSVTLCQKIQILLMSFLFH